MERLKQALERARAEREEAKSPGIGLVQPSRKPASGSAGQVHASPAQDIVYARTRTAAIDAARLRERRVITAATREPVDSAYKVLRTVLLQRMRANGWKTLGITAARQGNGKTLTAINLAISLAREKNQTVLLADFDLAHPSVARYLFDESLPGISDYLQGHRSLPEILVNPGIEGLVVLPGNEPIADSSERLTSPELTSLVVELKSRYPNRMIVFDLPPVLTGDDVMAFAPNVDGLLLVVEDGVTTKDDLRRAHDTLDASRIIGTVLNKAKAADLGYPYP